MGAFFNLGQLFRFRDRGVETAEFVDQSNLKGIFARVANNKGQVLSISAQEGRFLATTDSPDTIILRLTDGTIVQDTGGEDQTPRVLSFTRHDLPVDLPRVEEFRERGDAEREYILPELLQIGWSEAQPEIKRDASQASFRSLMFRRGR